MISDLAQISASLDRSSIFVISAVFYSVSVFYVLVFFIYFGLFIFSKVLKNKIVCSGEGKDRAQNLHDKPSKCCHAESKTAKTVSRLCES